MNNARRDAEWLAFNRPVEAPKGDDKVNHPSHYTEGRAFEVIEVLEDWCGRAPNPVLAALQWSSLKYQGRLWDKTNPLEDAKKSRWYLDRLIQKLEGKETAPVRPFMSISEIDDDEEEQQAKDADELISAKTKEMVELTLAMDDAIPWDGTEDLEEIEFAALGEKARINEIPLSVLPGPDDYIEDIYAAEAGFFGDYRKEEHKIITTHHVGGSILGTQKNGDVVILGKDPLYEEIKKSEPQDLAPSEYEDPWNYEEFLFERD